MVYSVEYCYFVVGVIKFWINIDVGKYLIINIVWVDRFDGEKVGWDLFLVICRVGWNSLGCFIYYVSCCWLVCFSWC